MRFKFEKKPRYTILPFVFSTFLLLTIFSSTFPVSGLSGNDFNPGRIIDDAVFYNASSMSTQQVQLFLNSKVPTCDTNGTQMYNSTQTRAQWAQANSKPLPPYVCLKDFTQTIPSVVNSGSDLCKGSIVGGSKTAAQIITDVAKACSINPQVLMVMLQKEQSLITDSWPWPTQYDKAMGYACPDSGPNFSANCNSEYFGFFNQVYNAAKAFRRYEANPNSYNYRARRNNFILYNPNTACGGTNVFIENQATANLYIYTPYQPNTAALNNLYGTGDGCSAYGNRNFWRLFNDWFGSTKLLPGQCDSKVNGIKCVWSLIKGDGSQFLTTSKSEVDIATSTFGWIFEGISFYASSTQRADTEAVYRLRLDNQHYYTQDVSDYNNKVTTEGWTDEGVAFYAYPFDTSNNISHQVVSLFNPVTNQTYLTIDQNRINYLTNIGYVLNSTPFSSFSGLAELPTPVLGRNNIYRLQTNKTYFYTTNLKELETVLKNGSSYEGVLTSSNASDIGIPIYRLQRRDGVYLYTNNISERNLAINNFGFSDEGVGFYLDDISSDLHRISNVVSGKYLYTSSVGEVLKNSNKNGWIYEGNLHTSNKEVSNVYRFLNLFTNRHFYTTSVFEAAKISNLGWQYETIAFRANKSIGMPVFRLLLNDKHFYTSNPNERDLAATKFGYIIEGVGFYASNETSGRPVYRLQGGVGDEYFYTASPEERDRAVRNFGYVYEGIDFYLPVE